MPMLIAARQTQSGKHVNICSKADEKRAKLIVAEAVRIMSNWTKDTAAKNTLVSCAPCTTVCCLTYSRAAPAVTLLLLEHADARGAILQHPSQAGLPMIDFLPHAGKDTCTISFSATH